MDSLFWMEGMEGLPRQWMERQGSDARTRPGTEGQGPPLWLLEYMCGCAVNLLTCQAGPGCAGLSFTEAVELMHRGQQQVLLIGEREGCGGGGGMMFFGGGGMMFFGGG